jgi:hypothetical protein
MTLVLEYVDSRRNIASFLRTEHFGAKYERMERNRVKWNQIDCSLKRIGSRSSRPLFGVYNIVKHLLTFLNPVKVGKHYMQ